MKSNIVALQKKLQAHAEPETKAWFENYLKGAIMYYGVKTPMVQRLLKSWRKEQNIKSLSCQQQLSLACELIHLPHAEEKFAGIIYIQQYLIGHISTNDIIAHVITLYQDKCFGDWSTTDWFTIRVLIPLIRHDETAWHHISQWQTSNNLWQKRSCIVAMKALVSDEIHIPTIETVINNSVSDERRFIQTAIGWVISDWSKHFPKQAASIVERYITELSKEVIDRHTRYLPKHNIYKQQKRIN